MKHRIIVFSLLILSVCLVSGCDMFRSLAGRPTSEDLAGMRLELAARETAELARKDSLEKVQARIQDSLLQAAAMDSLRQFRGLLRDPSRLGGFSSSFTPGHKFYAVIGSFKDRSNAERLLSRINDAGFPGELIPFRSGMTSVGACPSDRPAEFLEMLGRIKADPACPNDFWILVNE